MIRTSPLFRHFIKALGLVLRGCSKRGNVFAASVSHFQSMCVLLLLQHFGRSL